MKSLRKTVSVLLCLTIVLGAFAVGGEGFAQWFIKASAENSMDGPLVLIGKCDATIENTYRREPNPWFSSFLRKVPCYHIKLFAWLEGVGIPNEFDPETCIDITWYKDGQVISNNTAKMGTATYNGKFAYTYEPGDLWIPDVGYCVKLDDATAYLGAYYAVIHIKDTGTVIDGEEVKTDRIAVSFKTKPVYARCERIQGEEYSVTADDGSTVTMLREVRPSDLPDPYVDKYDFYMPGEHTSSNWYYTVRYYDTADHNLQNRTIISVENDWHYRGFGGTASTIGGNYHYLDYIKEGNGDGEMSNNGGGSDIWAWKYEVNGRGYNKITYVNQNGDKVDVRVGTPNWSSEYNHERTINVRYVDVERLPAGEGFGTKNVILPCPSEQHISSEPTTENEIAPNCTEDGSYDSVIYCSVCEEELSRETITIPAHGHTPADAVTENEIAATCTEDGSYDSVIYCSVCEEELSRETIVIPAHGHTPADAVTENEIAATCTEDGSYDSVIYCSVCGDELSREIITVKATGHSPVTAVVGNYWVTTCSVCGVELSRELVTSGSCGNNATWEYDIETHTLTISGSGNMYHYNSNSSITTAPWNAFYSEMETVEINGRITSIGKYAFYGCIGLTSINIPDSVTSIGDFAFSGCVGLTGITIPDSVTSIGTAAFKGLNQLTEITLPFVGHYESSSGEYAVFGYVFGYTSVSKSSSVPSGAIIQYTSTYNYCYYIPSSLRKVTVTKAASIPAYAFNNCSFLTEINLTQTVTNINNYAFQNCTGLTSVTIPDSVTSIGSCAFDGCTGLTSITIGNSVTSIGRSAFSHCTGLTNITIPDSVTSIGYDAFNGCTGLTSITIPDSVTSIGGSAFSYCTGLTSVTIPDSVTSIGGSAFSYCTGLTSITIPDSVISIGYWAFSYCTGLTSITIPDSITSIGNSAFYGCTGFTSVTIPDSVTSIGNSAFYGCTGLTSVTIPDSVISIGSYAFDDCTGLTSVTIPNSVTSIGDYAFDYCTGLTRVNINDIEAWCRISFSNETSNPLYFAHHLYLNNTEITDLVIPDRITSIGNYAFRGCNGLTSVTIPDSVTSIGSGAFYGCTSLTTVTIGNSVTSIGNYAFYNCTRLESVTIPDSVTNIGDYAFYNCTGLTDVYYCGTAEEWNNIDLGTNAVPFENATLNFHNPYNNFENETAPTCTEDGSYDSVVYCSVCGEELSRETITIPAHGHTPADAVTENEVAATCTEDGSYDSVVYCSVCGEELSRETVTVPATGHKPGGPNKESVVPTTCTVPGHYDRVIYCTVCGEELNRRTITIQATGHTPAEPVTENYYAPTCTYSGRYDSVVYCSACGEELSRETIMVYATGHNIKAFTVEPTCTNVGYTNYICLTCGNLIGQTTIIPAKGHTPGSPVAENETSATCHSAQHYDNVVYCSACGEELSRTTVTVPGTETEHTFADYHYNYDATETSDGTKTAKCVYCDATDTIPAPGTRITNSLKNAKLTVSKSQLVNFGSSATLNATATGVPEDYYLIIYEGNRFVAKGDNKSVSCVVEDITEDRVFTVKIADRYGNTKSAANTQKTVTVKVQTGFIYRLIEFFKKLFSIIPLIKQTS